MTEGIIVGHFIEKCGTCGDVVRQCRCPDKNKPVTIVTCDRCKAALANTGAQPK